MKFLFYFFLLQSDTCRESYLNEVFKSTNGKDYYLIVNAKQRGKGSIPIVLSRIDLSQNLAKKSGVVDDNVRKKINDGSFLLSLDDSSKWFTEVKYYKAINESKAKGKEYFIKKYFEDWGLLKDNVPFKYIGHIIQVLFNWNVLMSESEGNLYINRADFCK